MHLIERKEFTKREPEILVVGGGKGGVGKTCFSANIAVEIAQKGWRVVVVDADLSCSNLETVLGQHAEKRLDDFFLQRGGKNLSDVITQTNYPNLGIVSGTSGLLHVANPKFQQKAALIRELKRLDADLVVLDLAAGAHYNTLDFFLVTDTNGVLVVTPEKTSIDNAFKFLRSALFRKIERFYKSPEVAMLLRRNETLREFIKCIRETEAFDLDLRRRLCGEMVALARTVKPKIVVNRVRTEYEGHTTANILMRSVKEHLMIEPEYIGHIVFDNIVPEAVNAGVPFVMSHPRLKVSSCVSEIAHKLGYV